MDLKAVDKAFNQLFDVLKKIIELKRKGNITKPNAIHKCFRNFMDIYEELKEEEKFNIIDTMYKAHKDKILSGDDDWLMDDSPSLGIGKLKIYLGSFYNDAMKFKSDTEKELEGMPDSAYENRWEMTYPPRIKLYVYRILYGFHTDQTIKKELKKTIRDMENELGVENGENVKETQPNPMGNMFNVMSDMLSKIAKNNQTDGEEGTEKPDFSQLSSMVSQLFSRPETQAVVGNAFKSMDKIKNPQDLMGQMGNLMTNLTQDPALNKLVMGMVDGQDPTARSQEINKVREQIPTPDDLIARDGMANDEEKSIVYKSEDS
jgi:hypothetical protein